MITLHFVEAIDSTNKWFMNRPRHRIYQIGFTKEKLISVEVTVNTKKIMKKLLYHLLMLPSSSDPCDLGLFNGCRCSSSNTIPSLLDY